MISFTINNKDKQIQIICNNTYVWFDQEGFFRQEDDDIYAWMPDSKHPNYLSPRDIQSLAETTGCYPITLEQHQQILTHQAYGL